MYPSSRTASRTGASASWAARMRPAVKASVSALCRRLALPPLPIALPVVGPEDTGEITDEYAAHFAPQNLIPLLHLEPDAPFGRSSAKASTHGLRHAVEGVVIAARSLSLAPLARTRQARARAR